MLLYLASWGIGILLIAACLSRDTRPPQLDILDRAQRHILAVEFDFASWMLTALGGKLEQSSVGAEAYLDPAARAQLVLDYFDRVAQLEDVDRQMNAVYADPAVTDKDAGVAALSKQRADLQARIAEVQPCAEAILEEQIAVILAEQGITLGGQPVPPVSFRFTPLPLTLIVSPRDKIEQAANLPIDGNLPLDKQVALEDEVARAEDVSALVTGLGGIGTYPTMILQASYFNWIVSVGAHEWTHNYLMLHPLGVNYETTAELRTMNETTAEIVGNEIGAQVVARYYPDRVPPPAPFPNILRRDGLAATAPVQPAFNYNAEMRQTRQTAEALLAEGKIEAAEAYMEARRRFFWENGYQIRKLNQAYFAFYGAYAADAGGGAQGWDPVGPAVLLLRRRSASLSVFLETMAWFTDFGQLQRNLYPPP